MVIDLHGLLETEAIPAILLALDDLNDERVDYLEIVTGNGQVLRDVAIELILEEGCTYRHDGNNTGSLIVEKK